MSGLLPAVSRCRTPPVSLNEHIRYEPDQPCPPSASLGAALQGVLITLANTVLYVTITFRAGGQDESYLVWAVFWALVVSGIVTALQAGSIGRLGAGHVLMTGAGPHFIAVSVLALEAGGLALLASLIVVSSLIPFAMAAWLPLLRRIITPVVSGTALMLIAVTVMSIAFDRLRVVPEGAPPVAGPAVGAATLAVAAVLAMRAAGAWRFWASLAGIASDCATAALFGMYDIRRVIEAPWLDMPDFAVWEGVALTPGPEFWALLPAFTIISLVAAVKTSGDAVVIQQVSRVRPRAIDFRLVQGALNTNGLGTLLSGAAGTPPPIVYTPSCVALINLTGVAARSLGYAMGGMLLGLAFLPKATGLLLTIPTPAMGAFLLMIMGLLFVEGMRTIFQEGLDPQKAVVVAVSMAIGVSLERNIFEGLPMWGAALGNGVTLGVLAAILMTSFLELSSPRRRRLEAELEASALPGIDAFLQGLASRIRWSEASTERLRAAGEEAVSCLLQLQGSHGADKAPRLILTARPGRGAVEMEFLAVFEEENIEDRMAYLSDQAEVPEETEISFRLLRHYASSVRHRKYHGVDIVTVQVDGTR